LYVPVVGVGVVVVDAEGPADHCASPPIVYYPNWSRRCPIASEGCLTNFARSLVVVAPYSAGSAHFCKNGCW
jgi:hypothetical protein